MGVGFAFKGALVFPSGFAAAQPRLPVPEVSCDSRDGIAPFTDFED
jgi:hypothetical protein